MPGEGGKELPQSCQAVEDRPLGELAVEREGMLELQRTCSEADPLHQWVDAPRSSEWALWGGDGQ